MHLMIFDRRTCRWLPWHGTRAAWLKLPHAVATSLCVLSTVALRATSPLPTLPAHPHAASVLRPAITAPTPDNFSPIAAAVPWFAVTPPSSGVAPWFVAAPASSVGISSFSPPGSGSDRSSVASSPPVLINPTFAPDTRVPEPASLTLLAGAVLLLAAARRTACRHPLSRAGLLRRFSL